MSKRVYTISSIIFLVIVFFFYKSNSNENNNFVYIEAEKYSLYKDTFLVSGKLTASKDTLLSFQSTGEVENIFFENGDRNIKKGTILVSLNTDALEIELREQKAELIYQQNILEDIIAGESKETKETSQAESMTLQNNIKTKEEEALATLGSIINATQNDISTTIDVFFTNPEKNPRLNIKLFADVITTIETGRKQINVYLKDLKDFSNDKNNTQDKIKYINKVLIYIEKIDEYIGLVIMNLDNTLYREEIASLRGVRANIRLNIESITRISGEIKTALYIYNESLNRLNKILVGASKESINAYKARVAVQEARKLQVELKIKENKLRAPFDGRIGNINAQVGQTIKAGDIILRFVSEGKLEVKADISEINIVSVHIGDVVIIRSDIFQKELNGRVKNISFTENYIGNTPVYEATIEVLSQDQFLRPGITVSVEFIKDIYIDSIVVPNSALIMDGKNTSLLVKSPKGYITRNVTTGILLPGGRIQILKGIEEGEVVKINRK